MDAKWKLEDWVKITKWMSFTTWFSDCWCQVYIPYAGEWKILLWQVWQIKKKNPKSIDIGDSLSYVHPLYANSHGVCLFVCLFVCFRATPVVYGSPQARAQSCSCQPNTATATRDSSCICDYTTAHGNAGYLTHWVRPRIKPTSSHILVRFLTYWATVGIPNQILLKNGLSGVTRHQ